MGEGGAADALASAAFRKFHRHDLRRITGAAIRIKQIGRDLCHAATHRYGNTVATLTGIREYTVAAAQVCKAYGIVVDLCKACAVIERIAADGHKAFRQGQLAKTSAVIEGTITDGLQAFRQDQCLQCLAVIEGIVTDALAVAASDSQTAFDPRVIIEDGVCKLSDRSALAGSIATMDRLIRTMVHQAEIPLRDALRMISESPAKIMKVYDRKGSLEKGKDADMMILDEDLNLRGVWAMGKLVKNFE